MMIEWPKREENDVRSRGRGALLTVTYLQSEHVPLEEE